MRALVKRHAGFSLTELVVTLAVAMILMAVSMPMFLRAYHSYQLSTAANQVADILLLARYEAIRLNTPVQCIVQASAANPGYTNMWADTIRNGALDPTEKMTLLGPSGNLVDGGSVPGAPAMLQAAVGSYATTPLSPILSGVSFDARGAVIVSLVSPVPLNEVSVFYLNSPSSPEAGYRAVLLLPSGSIQVWTSDSSGNWQQQR